MKQIKQQSKCFYHHMWKWEKNIVLPSSTERMFIYQGWYSRVVTVVYIIYSGSSISSVSIIFVQGIVFIQGHGVSWIIKTVRIKIIHAFSHIHCYWQDKQKNQKWVLGNHINWNKVCLSLNWISIKIPSVHIYKLKKNWSSLGLNSSNTEMETAKNGNLMYPKFKKKCPKYPLNHFQFIFHLSCNTI